MTIKVEAFLDLENSLTSYLYKAWTKAYSPLFQEVGEAVAREDFIQAYDLLESIHSEEVIRRQVEYIQQLGMQAALYGAANFAEPRDTLVYGKGKSEPIESSAELLVMLLSRLLDKNIKATSVQLVAQYMQVVEALKYQGEIITKGNLLVVRKAPEEEPEVGSTKDFVRGFVSAVDTEGKSIINFGSSLHTSRLANWGFLTEANVREWTAYRVSEQMDKRTCPICRIMHGKKFRVEQAHSRLENQLAITDPDELKAVAPFPKGSKAALQLLSEMTTSELVEKGWDTPPYHPRCRGVLRRTKAKAPKLMICHSPCKPAEASDRALCEEQRDPSLVARIAKAMGFAHIGVHVIEGTFITLKLLARVASPEIIEKVLNTEKVFVAYKLFKGDSLNGMSPEEQFEQFQQGVYKFEVAAGYAGSFFMLGQGGFAMASLAAGEEVFGGWPLAIARVGLPIGANIIRHSKLHDKFHKEYVHYEHMIRNRIEELARSGEEGAHDLIERLKVRLHKIGKEKEFFGADMVRYAAVHGYDAIIDVTIGGVAKAGMVVVNHGIMQVERLPIVPAPVIQAAKYLEGKLKNLPQKRFERKKTFYERHPTVEKPVLRVSPKKPEPTPEPPLDPLQPGEYRILNPAQATKWGEKQMNYLWFESNMTARDFLDLKTYVYGHSILDKRMRGQAPVEEGDKALISILRRVTQFSRTEEPVVAHTLYSTDDIPLHYEVGDILRNDSFTLATLSKQALTDQVKREGITDKVWVEYHIPEGTPAAVVDPLHRKVYDREPVTHEANIVLADRMYYQVEDVGQVTLAGEKVHKYTVTVHQRKPSAPQAEGEGIRLPGEDQDYNRGISAWGDIMLPEGPWTPTQAQYDAALERFNNLPEVGSDGNLLEDFLLIARQQLGLPRDITDEELRAFFLGMNSLGTGMVAPPFKQAPTRLVTWLIKMFSDPAKRAKWEAHYARSKVVEIQVDLLEAIQPIVLKDKVKSMLPEDPFEMGDNLPHVVQVAGHLLIADGHHRATAAKLQGYTTIKVNLSTYEETFFGKIGPVTLAPGYRELSPKPVKPTKYSDGINPVPEGTRGGQVVGRVGVPNAAYMEVPPDRGPKYVPGITSGEPSKEVVEACKERIENMVPVGEDHVLPPMRRADKEYDDFIGKHREALRSRVTAAEVVEVSLDDIATTRTSISKDILLDHISMDVEAPHFYPPVLVEFDAGYVVYSGEYLIAAAVIQGRRTIKVKIITCPEEPDKKMPAFYWPKDYKHFAKPSTEGALDITPPDYVKPRFEGGVTSGRPTKEQLEAAVTRLNAMPVVDDLGEPPAHRVLPPGAVPRILPPIMRLVDDDCFWVNHYAMNLRDLLKDVEVRNMDLDKVGSPEWVADPMEIFNRLDTDLDKLRTGRNIVMAVEHAGYFYLVNGNNLVNAAYLLGKKSIPAHILKLEDLPDEIKPTQPLEPPFYPSWYLKTKPKELLTEDDKAKGKRPLEERIWDYSEKESIYTVDPHEWSMITFGAETGKNRYFHDDSFGAYRVPLLGTAEGNGLEEVMQDIGGFYSTSTTDKVDMFELRVGIDNLEDFQGMMNDLSYITKEDMDVVIPLWPELYKKTVQGLAQGRIFQAKGMLKVMPDTLQAINESVVVEGKDGGIALVTLPKGTKLYHIRGTTVPQAVLLPGSTFTLVKRAKKTIKLGPGEGDTHEVEVNYLRMLDDGSTATDELLSAHDDVLKELAADRETKELVKPEVKPEPEPVAPASPERQQEVLEEASIAFFAMLEQPRYAALKPIVEEALGVDGHWVLLDQFKRTGHIHPMVPVGSTVFGNPHTEKTLREVTKKLESLMAENIEVVEDITFYSSTYLGSYKFGGLFSHFTYDTAVGMEKLIGKSFYDIGYIHGLLDVNEQYRRIGDTDNWLVIVHADKDTQPLLLPEEEGIPIEILLAPGVTYQVEAVDVSKNTIQLRAVRQALPDPDEVVRGDYQVFAPSAEDISRKSVETKALAEWDSEAWDHAYDTMKDLVNREYGYRSMESATTDFLRLLKNMGGIREFLLGYHRWGPGAYTPYDTYLKTQYLIELLDALFGFSGHPPAYITTKPLILHKLIPSDSITDGVWQEPSYTLADLGGDGYRENFTTRGEDSADTSRLIDAELFIPPGTPLVSLAHIMGRNLGYDADQMMDTMEHYPVILPRNATFRRVEEIGGGVGYKMVMEPLTGMQVTLPPIEARKTLMGTGVVEDDKYLYSDNFNEDFTFIRNLGGSHGVGLYRDKRTKKMWAVKEVEDIEHAVNEILTAKFYEAAGFRTLEPKMLDAPGEAIRLASHYRGDLVTLSDTTERTDFSRYKGLWEGFGMDAWLAHWDAFGAMGDNMMVPKKGGAVVRIDTGGGLLYRARGEPKGATFGDEVHEIDTMRDPKFGSVTLPYRKLTDRQLYEIIKRTFINMTSHQIHYIVDTYGPSGSAGMRLKVQLVARRKWMMEQANAWGKLLPMLPAERGTPTTYEKLDGGYDRKKSNTELMEHYAGFWEEVPKPSEILARPVDFWVVKANYEQQILRHSVFNLDEDNFMLDEDLVLMGRSWDGPYGPERSEYIDATLQRTRLEKDTIVYIPFSAQYLTDEGIAGMNGIKVLKPSYLRAYPYRPISNQNYARVVLKAGTPFIPMMAVDASSSTLLLPRGVKILYGNKVEGENNVVTARVWIPNVEKQKRVTQKDVFSPVVSNEFQASLVGWLRRSLPRSYALILKETTYSGEELPELASEPFLKLLAADLLQAIPYGPVPHNPKDAYSDFTEYFVREFGRPWLDAIERAFEAPILLPEKAIGTAILPKSVITMMCGVPEESPVGACIGKKLAGESYIPIRVTKNYLESHPFPVDGSNPKVKVLFKMESGIQVLPATSLDDMDGGSFDLLLNNNLNMYVESYDNNTLMVRVLPKTTKLLGSGYTWTRSASAAGKWSQRQSILFDKMMDRKLEALGSESIKLEDLEKTMDDIGIVHNIYEGADGLALYKLVIPKNLRDKGIGSQVMQLLTTYADSKGKSIVLTPATDYGATSVTRLRKFYKRFGFVENKGRTKDFSFPSGSMYRLPLKGVPSEAAVRYRVALDRVHSIVADDPEMKYTQSDSANIFWAMNTQLRGSVAPRYSLEQFQPWMGSQEVKDMMAALDLVFADSAIGVTDNMVLQTYMSVSYLRDLMGVEDFYNIMHGGAVRKSYIEKGYLPAMLPSIENDPNNLTWEAPGTSVKVFLLVEKGQGYIPLYTHDWWDTTGFLLGRNSKMTLVGGKPGVLYFKVTPTRRYEPLALESTAYKKLEQAPPVEHLTLARPTSMVEFAMAGSKEEVPDPVWLWGTENYYSGGSYSPSSQGVSSSSEFWMVDTNALTRVLYSLGSDEQKDFLTQEITAQGTTPMLNWARRLLERGPLPVVQLDLAKLATDEIILTGSLGTDINTDRLFQLVKLAKQAGIRQMPLYLPLGADPDIKKLLNSFSGLLKRKLGSRSHVITTTDRWVNAHTVAVRKSQIAGWMEDKNIDPDAFQQYANIWRDRLDEIVSQENVRVVMQIKGEHLEQVFADGRIKSQFETNHSNGALSHDARSQAEIYAFGYPYDLPLELRPTYGHILDIDHLLEGNNIAQLRNVTHYGLFTLVYKNEIASRATLSFGDTLAQCLPYTERYNEIYPLPTLVANPDIYGLPLTRMKNDFELVQGSVEAQMDAAKAATINDLLEYHLTTGYLESQVHGGSSLDDIEAVYYMGKVLSSYGEDAATEDMLNRLRERLAEYNIPLYVPE